MAIQHSLVIFQESLQSEKSRKKYTYLVGLFKNYYKIKDFDRIIEIEKSDIQKMVETYVIHIKKTVNPNTVPTYINPIKTFLETNDIDLNWRKIKRLYPHKIKRSGNSAYQTEDVFLMLDATNQPRNKALIHFFASSGCRVGAVEDLKIKHLRDMPHGCKMVMIYEDSTEEYYTFLTPEASDSLDKYLNERKTNGEYLTDDSPLFRERYQLAETKPRALSTEAIQGVIKRSATNASIRGQKKNGRYAEQLVHGFRKRFNTILKMNNEVNDNAIEKMMGHTNGLDGVYLQITPEQLFEEFKKGIVDLTIASGERDKIKIRALEKEKTEINELSTKVDELQTERTELNQKISDVVMEKHADELYEMVAKKLGFDLKKSSIEKRESKK
ncbi:MAG: tyrosine-type recombinase/integrase [Thaumarchaeota archaeon]|nr:tyrosine-type recombinase/integrase [Nitrososphaerota archaeon]